jgi:hypothetical protein
VEEYLEIFSDTLHIRFASCPRNRNQKELNNTELQSKKYSHRLQQEFGGSENYISWSMIDEEVGGGGGNMTHLFF